MPAVPPETQTANYGWIKPYPTGSTATWGATLNADLDQIDAQVFTMSNPAALSVSSTPGTSTPGKISFLNSAAPAGQKARWLFVEDTTAESGGNVGSNFSLQAYSDAGALISSPMSFTRSNGAVSISGAATFGGTTLHSGLATFSNGATISGNTTVSGTMSVGSTMTVTGAAVHNGAVQINGAAGSNRSLFGLTGGLTRWEAQLGGSAAESGGNTGSNFVLNAYNDAGVSVVSTPLTIIRATGSATFSAPINFYGGQATIQATAAAPNPALFLNTLGGTNVVQFYYNASTALVTCQMGSAYWAIDNTGSFNVSGATAYKPGGGSWTALSDERIKTVTGDYALGLEEVLQLQPVNFVYRGNDTSAPGEPSPHGELAADQTPFVGFVAQELERIFPSMVGQREAYIDGQMVSDLRSVNTSELLYALVNAVKTLAARVEELEAAR